MGDMADYYLDREEIWFPAPLTVPPRCRFCCVGKVHWRRLDVGWRLHNADGTVHTCDEYTRCQRLA